MKHLGSNAVPAGRDDSRPQITLQKPAACLTGWKVKGQEEPGRHSNQDRSVWTAEPKIPE